MNRERRDAYRYVVERQDTEVGGNGQATVLNTSAHTQLHQDAVQLERLNSQEDLTASYPCSIDPQSSAADTITYHKAANIHAT